MNHDELNPVPPGNEIKGTYPDVNPTPAGLNPSSTPSEPGLGGTIARNVEAAPMTAKAAGVARDLVDRLAEKAADAEVRIRSTSHQAGDEMRSRADDMQQQTRALADTVEQYLQEHPFRALGIAFGAGMLLSIILRRS